MDPAGIGALIVSAGSAVAGFLAYRRNRKADDALNLSKSIDLVLGGQQHLIDDLREEADRNRAGWNECLDRCARLQHRADEQDAEIASQSEEITELRDIVDMLKARLHEAGLA